MPWLRTQRADMEDAHAPGHAPQVPAILPPPHRDSSAGNGKQSHSGVPADTIVPDRSSIKRQATRPLSSSFPRDDEGALLWSLLNLFAALPASDNSRTFRCI